MFRARTVHAANRPINLGALDVTKPYKFMEFGALAVTKLYTCMKFAAMDVTKVYKTNSKNMDQGCHLTLPWPAMLARLAKPAWLAGRRCPTRVLKLTAS